MNSPLHWSSFQSPLGDFSFAVDPAGALVGAAFGGLDVLQTRCGPGEFVRDEKRTAAVRAQLAEYFAGARREFTLALAPRGTPFQQRVWSALRAIPPGATRSYGALAKTLRTSARAVGRANATNPVCLVVPCHRVIGADGSLTGYAFGEAIKQRLLDLERAA